VPASDLSDPQREILNLDEAAAYLGVSSKTFQKVLREGELPGRKVGREWKFSRKALEAWIGSGRSRDFLDVDESEDEAAPAVAPLAAAAAAGANGANGASRAAAAAPPASRRVPHGPVKTRHGGAFEAEED
jgi:excisionase family DNA binding protein